MTFRILTVCTGNICRSPQAEQLLRAGLVGLDVEISSAGTHAMVGSPMDPTAAALSREYGGDPTDHVPRQLTREIVEQHDLILALAREHRSAVAKLLPRASRYTFTLREFARIVDSLSGDPLSGLSSDARSAPRIETQPLAALTTLAAQSRGLYPAALADDDIVDPYRRSDATYRRSIEQIAPAVALVTAAATRVHSA